MLLLNAQVRCINQSHCGFCRPCAKRQPLAVAGADFCGSTALPITQPAVLRQGTEGNLTH